MTNTESRRVMKDEVNLEDRIKTVQPGSYTLTSMQIARLVNVMYKINGTYPALKELIATLSSDEELQRANPRAAKRPETYWEHAVTKELAAGGVLQVVEGGK